MDKIKLNNQVVLMRKHVKQAKVHTINKLVKQLKFLQNRKGNEIQIQKAKRKAERFLKEISLLKKMKPDDVSKLALSKVKDWKEVLLQKNSTLEDRCVAMLATYESVKKAVEVFLSANKELTYKIPVFLTQWEEKNKLNKDFPQIKKMRFEKPDYTNSSKIVSQIPNESNKNRSKAVFNSENVDTSSCQIKIDSIESKPGKNKMKDNSKLNLDKLRDLNEISVNITHDESCEEEEESNDGSINKEDKEKSQKNMHFIKSKNHTNPSKIISHVAENKPTTFDESCEEEEKSDDESINSEDDETLRKKMHFKKSKSPTTPSKIISQITEDKPTTFDESCEEEEKSDDESINCEDDETLRRKMHFKKSKIPTTPSKVISQITEDKSTTFDESCEEEEKSDDESINCEDDETLRKKMHFKKSKSSTTPSKIDVNKSKHYVNKAYDEFDEESSNSSINNVDDETLPKITHFVKSKNCTSSLKIIPQVAKEKFNKNESDATFNSENNSQSFPRKTEIESKHGENKIKSITKLNLDELKDLDEIPVNRSYEESSENEEESDDDSIHNENDETSQSDPFFLGHDEAVSSENKLVDNPKNNMPIDRIFDRRDKSYQPSFKKDFKESINHSQFRDSSGIQNRKSFRALQKGNFMTKNDQNRFQHKNKNSFVRKDFTNNFKSYNQNEDKFVKKELKPFLSEPYGNKQHSKRPFNRNEHHNSLKKSKELPKKDDINVKPLHPSWEAKRKQKVTNATFQGKRKVFED